MPREAVEQQKRLKSADFLDYSQYGNLAASLRRLILIRIVEASQIDPTTLLFFQQPQPRFDLFHPPRQHGEQSLFGITPFAARDFGVIQVSMQCGKEH